MTQSAVSQAIARLEEQIGVQVLDRSNREVVLTRARPAEEREPVAGAGLGSFRIPGLTVTASAGPSTGRFNQFY